MNNSSGSACVLFVYLCLCQDKLIFSLVNLKPKLPRTDVDGSVSPTHCPRGSQDRDHCSGSCLFTHMKHRLGLHRAQKWLIPKSGWRGGHSVLLFSMFFFTNACTYTRNKQSLVIAASQAQRENLLVSHTCQRQMLRINQRDAQSGKKLCTVVTLLTHYTVN